MGEWITTAASLNGVSYLGVDTSISVLNPFDCLYQCGVRMMTSNYVVMFGSSFYLIQIEVERSIHHWGFDRFGFDRLWTARRAADSAKFAKQNYSAHSLQSSLGSGASQQTLLIDPRLPWELKANLFWVDSTHWNRD